jgi:hypothetical protein
MEAMFRRRKLLAYTLSAAVLNALIAAVMSAQPIFYGEALKRGIFFDVGIYYDYASKALAGRVPYRDYVVEYPILAFPLFCIPCLIAFDLKSYEILFAGQMLVVNALVLYLVARRVDAEAGIQSVPARLVWYSVYFFSLSPMVLARYDLAPTALAFAAACWWFTGSNAWGGMAAAAGALMKIFPGVIAGPALVWEVSRLKSSRARGLIAFSATLAAGIALWAAVGGDRWKESLRYHLVRGIEVGSVYAGLLDLQAALTGSPIKSVVEHSAYHVRSAWSNRLAASVLPIQVATLFLVLGRSWRTGMKEPIRCCASAILALVLTGKVLSPQYLIWLFPFIASLEGPVGRRARWLFLACCLTTTAIYPHFYWRLVHFNYLAIGLLNVRNLLLAGLLALLLFGPEITERSALKAHAP